LARNGDKIDMKPLDPSTIKLQVVLSCQQHDAFRRHVHEQSLARNCHLTVSTLIREAIDRMVKNKENVCQTLD
jgi:hypothetical protein